MFWNPKDRDGWRLDIVSLLAVLGESAMSRHSLPMTASRLCMLPRIVPAPQSLLISTRPYRLKPERANIAGIHSGVVHDEVNHFASRIYSISLPKFTVRHVTIRYRTAPSSGGAETSEPQTPTSPLSNAPPQADIESDARTEARAKRLFARFRLRRRTTILNSWGAGFRKSENIIRPQRFSPLALLAVGSCVLTMGLLLLAILLGDGIAVISIVTISLTSSITGLSSFWRPCMISRKAQGDVPAGDLVLRTRHGAFVIIRCEEGVARELFTSTEECEYWLGEKMFNVLAGIATFLLMLGVLLMGNCTRTMQAALGGSYILLNGCYQVAALLSDQRYWDFSRYEVVHHEAYQEDNYTDALWKAIDISGRIGWVNAMQAAPETSAWKLWLSLAEQNIGKSWDPRRCLDDLVKDEKKRWKEKDDERKGKANVQTGQRPTAPVSEASRGRSGPSAGVSISEGGG